MPERESDFADAVMQYAVFLGWRPYCIARSDRAGLRGGRGGVGWPDAIFAKEGRLIAAEFKTGRRATTDAQREWLALLDGVAGCDAVVWRPDDPAPGEFWRRVETAAGPDFGEIGRRLRGE